MALLVATFGCTQIKAAGSARRVSPQLRLSSVIANIRIIKLTAWWFAPARAGK